MIKSLFYLFVIACICVGAMIGGLNSGNILLGYGIAFAVLALVSYRYLRHTKKVSERKFREDLFSQHWRTVRKSR